MHLNINAIMESAKEEHWINQNIWNNLSPIIKKVVYKSPSAEYKISSLYILCMILNYHM